MRSIELGCNALIVEKAVLFALTAAPNDEYSGTSYPREPTAFASYWSTELCVYIYIALRVTPLWNRGPVA